MNTNRKPTVVIGAGIGGLSAAIHLAAAGYPAVVLEQNPKVGGKMARLSQDGFTWDTGPSVITMRPVLEALFHTAGRRLEDYLTLTPVDPITRYHYSDGSTLDATRDLPTMVAQIESRNPRDVEGFFGFLSHAAALERITGPIFVRGDPPTLHDLLRVPIRDMLKVDAWRTMEAAIQHWVEHPHLRALLGRYATYVGASPFRAPAVLNVIAHQELTAGIWYARGGIYTIAQAYRRLAEELGVQIRTRCRVSNIQVDSARHATGVTLEDGSRISARAVVANVDVITAYHDLLPRKIVKRRLQRLLRPDLSLSGFVMLLGIRGRTSALAQHNIIFPPDYRQEFEDIFQRGMPPTSPTIYVTISARRDPDHAPDGCENWFVLVNAPPVNAGSEVDFDWAVEAPLYRERVFDRLAAAGLDPRGRILSAAYRTPLDLQTETGAWRGSLYGFSSNHPLNALRRPHPRDPRIRGLYFVGGTTHPGGGIPLVTLSGATVARMIEADREAHAT